MILEQFKYSQNSFSRKYLYSYFVKIDIDDISQEIFFFSIDDLNEESFNKISIYN